MAVRSHLERLETIRSKSPGAVAQEMWGILLVYNLVRLEMERIAEELGVPPTRISFVAALRHFAELWLVGSKSPSPARCPSSSQPCRIASVVSSSHPVDLIAPSHAP